MAEEDFTTGVVDGEVSVIVWTVLYDLARSLTPDELDQMKETYGASLDMNEQDLQALANHILEVKIIIIYVNFP